MKNFFLIIFLLFIYACSKPQTVFICGDHKCVNKAEAEQYFRENLSIQVKIIDKKKKDNIDLVELNLKEHRDGQKKISISPKKTTKNLKVLSNDEISQIKREIKIKKKAKVSNDKMVKINKKSVNKKNNYEEISKNKDIVSKNKTTSLNGKNKNNEVLDICTIVEKCSIDEISKYLLNKGKKKGFPNLTKRQ